MTASRARPVPVAPPPIMRRSKGGLVGVGVEGVEGGGEGSEEREGGER